MNATDIKKLRVDMGLTQEGLAHLIGVSFVTVNRWENGIMNPSPLAMQKLSALNQGKIR